MDELKKEKKKIKETMPRTLESDLNKERKIKIISIIISGIIFILLILSTIFALINKNTGKIISKVKLNNIEVAGLKREEATNLIKEKTNENLEKEISLVSDDFKYTIKLSDIETQYDIENAVDNALAVGRNQNVFKNNFNIIKSIFCETNIEIETTYNEEMINNILTDICDKIPNAVEQSTYTIEDDKLIIIKGKDGNSIDIDKTKSAIIDKINNFNDNTIVLNVSLVQANPIDIKKIHDEIYKEPTNAYYTKEPFVVYQHVNGIDFDVEKAKEILKEDKEIYEIQLDITVPEITTDKIGTEAFPDLLSVFTTKYDAGNINRSTNLRLAASAINGTVLMPGEVFSYNKVVGERTAAKGYKAAHGFSGGKVVDMIGGGICQIASTLYDAAVYANLEIVERTNHVFDPSYVVAGKDATVVYGAIDFKFKNTRNYPIMIKGYASNGIAKMEIYGIKEDVEYEVEIVSNILSYIPYSVVYEDDNSLAAGQEVVSQYGMQGMTSSTYKILKLNGAEVSRTLLSKDTYKAMNKIIRRGPESSTNVETSVPEETVEEIQPVENVSEEVVTEIAPSVENVVENVET